MCRPSRTIHRNSLFILAALLWLPIFASPTLRAEAPQSALPAPGVGIERAMTMLAESTPDRRYRVRVLFYGQSITEQDWTRQVADDLKSRFPHADLVIENRALGGFSSQRLVKTAETDLYPFQPDLLIFYVFGAHNAYEDIIRRTRERTTADILIQTDHVAANRAWRDEPTDPEQITPADWPSFMNYKHLPSVIDRYDCGFVDQRNLWKQHLRDTGREAAEYLRDNIHLNESGCQLMADIVSDALVHRDDVPIDPMNNDRVKTLIVGEDVRFDGDTLRIDFVGNRVDLVAKSDCRATYEINIDGKPPSEHADLYQFTRALATPGGKWPVLAELSSDAKPLLETWSMDVSRDEENESLFHFQITGSRTGPDGKGRSDERFVSDSGRVVIDPSDWDVAYALRLAGVAPVPAHFRVSWKVVPNFLDRWTASPTSTDRENVVMVAHGLEDGPHTLRLSGDREGIHAVRIYSPKGHFND